MIFKCKECGKNVDTDGIIGGIEYGEKELCVTCDVFTDILKSFKEQSYVIVNGTCYRIGTADNTYSRGHAGRLFKIRLKCCGFIFETTNLWDNGKVPECFRDRLPDNAEFVSNISRKGAVK